MDTTTRRPAATTPARTPAHTTTRAPPRATGTATRAATTTRRTGTGTGRPTAISGTATSTITTGTPTPTETPSSGGMSGGAIGGIIAGVLVAFAAVFGLLFYKRRKRRNVAGKGGNLADANPPAYQAPSSGPGISGPLALAPDSGVSANEKQKLPEAQYNENKHFQPGMRDELLAMPGKGPNNNNNNNNKSGAGDGGYYDSGLVQDYYGSPTGEPPIGAQQPMRKPSNKSLHHGNQTPVPGQIHQQDNHPNGGAGRRGSSASDASDGSGFLTYEEAQKAHNRKMMGHKQSISSEEDLEKYKAQLPEYQQHQGQPYQQSQGQPYPQPQGPPQQGMDGKPQYGDMLSPTDARFRTNPEHNSVAMTESTVSMMPALPPSATPLPTGRPGGGNASPYAESAFSDEVDDRSAYGGAYYGDGGNHYGAPPPHHYNHPASPPYSPYSNHNAYPPRGGPPPNHYPQHSPPYGGGGYRPGPPGGGYQSSPMMQPHPGNGGGGPRSPVGGPQQRPGPPPPAQQRSNGATGLGPLMQHDPHNPFPPRGSPHRQPW
ncbi:hypothetical protein BGW41_002930 [Actinomortierella wolfii]|nr:hypothetical protein BGW41_002930 [Actinomortierella wolfii]